MGWTCRPRSLGRAGALHLIVDSTGLKFHGPGEWSAEKHGAKKRRSWRKLHIGLDADTDQIVVSELTRNDIDDGSRVGPLLHQIAGPVSHRSPAMTRIREFPRSQPGGQRRGNSLQRPYTDRDRRAGAEPGLAHHRTASGTSQCNDRCWPARPHKPRICGEFGRQSSPAPGPSPPGSRL